MSFIDQKIILRDRLIQERNWRRCNRTKKFETYKKKIAGRTHRFQFNVYWATNDIWVEGSVGRRGYWQNIEMIRYDSMVMGSQEDRETDEYLERLGIAA